MAILLTLMGCIALQSLYAAPSPLKKVRQAEKMAIDHTKHASARSLLKEVLADSAFTPDAYTWHVCALVEREAYKHYYKRLSINRNDPTVDLCAMADALMDSYAYALRCMALDSLPDKKGRVKTKYSAPLAEWINMTAPAMYNAGIAYMNKKKYWPQAYGAFVKYASLPDSPFYKPVTPMGDSIRANAYFYGGVMAYNAGQYVHALQAFDKARAHGYTRKEVYLNQISSLSHIARDNAQLRDSASRLITAVAADGLRRHGVDATPVFIQKYVAGCLIDSMPAKALAAIDTALVTHPGMVMLHSMRAGVLSTMGNEDEAVAEYKRAASCPQADAETLKAASKYLAGKGIALLLEVKGRSRQAKKRARQIKQDYLEPALEYAGRAAATLKDDPELLNITETVTYHLH